MICHYWYFKNLAYKCELHVCNKWHDVVMTAYELKNIAMLTLKGVDYKRILWGVGKNEAFNIPNNFVLEDKGVL